MRLRFGKFTLVDSRNGIPLQNLRVSGQRGVQMEEFPGGDGTEENGEEGEIDLFNRGNRHRVWSFQTERKHKDDEAAQRFAVLHDEELPITDTFTTGGTRGGWKKFYHKAALQSVESWVMGCTSYHSYQIVTGPSSAKAVAETEA